MKEKKSEYLKFRCKPSDKSKIEAKAEKRNMKLSDYLTESALSGKRNASRMKKNCACHIVPLQEGVNKFKDDIECQGEFVNKEYVVMQINEIQEEVDELWEILL